MAPLLAALALVGCTTTTPPTASGVGGKVGETASLLLRPATPLRQVSYRETEAFDAALNSAMRAGSPEIAVVFAPPVFERASLAEASDAASASRLHRWLYEVEARGGELVVCFNPPVEDRRGLGVLAWLALGALVDLVRDEILYRPAAAYDARLVVGRDTDLVEETVFVRRGEDGTVACPEPAPAG